MELKSEKESANVIQVCTDKECDKKPTEPFKIGSQTHVYCCQKGFDKSLKDFLNYLGHLNKRQKS